jgi:hypothetical protein
VGRFTRDIWLLTHPLPVKGAAHPWIIKKLTEDVQMSGLVQIMIKTDQEPAILDLKRVLIKQLKETAGVTIIEAMPEESPVQASQSNAVVERAVWEMQSTTRSLVAYAEWVHNTK